jgi:hypothetical protein
MIVEVDLRTQPAAARLVEPDDFGAFKLVLLDNGPSAGARLAEAGIPMLEEHAWVPLDLVRELAGDAASAEWEGSFAAMVEFARGRGWLDEELAAIRAHVERPSV